MASIAVLGGGRIGEAFLAGSLSSGVDPRDVVVSEKSEKRARELSRRYGVRSMSVRDAGEEASTLVIAVKPGDAEGVVAALVDVIEVSEKDKLVVSLAAGLTTEWFESQLPAGTAVVRVMPNTPMLVNKGMCVVAGGRYATEEHLAAVSTMLEPVGRVLVMPESSMDAVTAVSGSGPAYFFLMVEAMVDAAVTMGLPRPAALELVVQTMVGAGEMLVGEEERGGALPLSVASDLRYAVTSPGGTTAAALAELERQGFRGAVLDALGAARARSVELGKRG
ncbi:pyrroline-5-carboxylate reductase [Hoyosella sp. G463]|uniref:Pyrroline-5-carboxylate reductase n=1 Tax=Lolliginicoccus lacisalsi TaxID=2742202 RepID=A0A927PKE7_9ACTN|nr:pyrroline-5-carboxylate reductase [Lolliginicoccus lacisalsi]MBD8505940.1 pyrroline-5-carboxylate reductase [Lolliginicoccus lacisalsi]